MLLMLLLLIEERRSNRRLLLLRCHVISRGRLSPLVEPPQCEEVLLCDKGVSHLIHQSLFMLLLLLLLLLMLLNRGVGQVETRLTEVGLVAHAH